MYCFVAQDLATVSVATVHIEISSHVVQRPCTGMRGREDHQAQHALDPQNLTRMIEVSLIALTAMAHTTAFMSAEGVGANVSSPR